MSQTRKHLAQVAVSEAMKVRKRARYSLDSPISVYDLCERLEVAVFFQDIPSMEGIYLPDAQPKPAIVVSSLRPSGRKAMTCGHELGHHIFGHGKQWDELVEDRNEARRFEPDEFQADLFAASLHMPKIAVSHAMAQRGYNPNTCPSETIYSLSTLFGVSYGAFITHLERTLNLIGMDRAAELLRRQPKDIRQSLLGGPCPQNLIAVEFHWRDRAIDVEVGDSILLPPHVELEGACGVLVKQTTCMTLINAVQPGIGRVFHESNWSAYVRVMRKGYVGLATLRFDEEVEDAD